MGKVKPLQKYSPACDVDRLLKEYSLSFFFLVYNVEIQVSAKKNQRSVMQVLEFKYVYLLL